MSEPSAAKSQDKKRGCNYSSEEDVCIARSYIHASTDPIVGSEQKAHSYYQRIYNHYKDNKPSNAPLRPLSSIESRLKDIQKLCVRFSACYASVKKMKRSGVNHEDEIRLSTALFNKIKVEHPSEDVGRKFKYIDAWMILREMPKFSVDGLEDKSTSDTNSTSSVCLEGESSSENKKSQTDKKKHEMGRPTGRKRAKEIQMKEEQQNKKIRLAQSALEIQKKQVQELEEHNLILLFTNGPGGNNSQNAQEFFSLKQKEALEKLRAKQRKNQEGSNETETNVCEEHNVEKGNVEEIFEEESNEVVESEE